MPIEVREILIKATIAQEGESGTSTASSALANGGSGTEEIINECVEKIIEILKDKHER